MNPANVAIVGLTEPLPTFNFSVEIEGLWVGGFQSVSGLRSEIQTSDRPEGGVNDRVHKLLGGVSYANVVLRSGMTMGSTLSDWYEHTVSGVVERRNGTILMLDRRQLPVVAWNFWNAVPVRWDGPQFSADASELAFEAIELVHEGMTKVTLGPIGGLAEAAAGLVNG